MSERTTRGEGSQSTIVIEGIERLGMDDNFYEQFPFNQVLEPTARFTNFPLSDLRHMITRIGQQLATKQHPKGRDEHINDIVENCSNYLPAKKYGMVERRKVSSIHGLSHVIRRVITVLDNYPDWEEYINNRFVQGEYLPDGTYTPKQRIPQPSESYLEWASRRRARQGRIKALRVSEVLDEVFAQQRKGMPVREMIGQGARPTKKKYALIRAMGI